MIKEKKGKKFIVDGSEEFEVTKDKQGNPVIKANVKKRKIKGKNVVYVRIPKPSLINQLFQ